MTSLRKSREASSMYGEIKLFAGTASPELAAAVANYLNLPLSGRQLGYLGCSDLDQR